MFLRATQPRRAGLLLSIALVACDAPATPAEIAQVEMHMGSAPDEVVLALQLEDRHHAPTRCAGNLEVEIRGTDVRGSDIADQEEVVCHGSARFFGSDFSGTEPTGTVHVRFESPCRRDSSYDRLEVRVRVVPDYGHAMETTIDPPADWHWTR